MKRKWLWIGLAVVAVVLLVGMNIARGKKGKIESVQLAKVRVEDVTSRVRAPGKIEPHTQVKVSAEIPGKVVRLAVKEGDRVKRGDLLLQLDDTQYRAAFDQSRAAQSTGEGRLREAQAVFKTTESNYQRQRALFEKGLLSQAEWDQASNAYESARTAVQTAQEEVARARAVFSGARDNLAKTRFVTPIDGVVSALNVEQGEIVITGTMNPPGTQILTVSDLSRMLVRADVDETDVVDMVPGQKAKITVDALPDTSFDGTVIEIGNTAKRSITSTVEGQTNFEVKVVFDRDVPQIRPGMTADVEIATATHDKTRAVPIQSVVVRSERELERASRTAGKKKERAKRNTAEAAIEDTAGKKDKEITGLFVVRNDVARFIAVRTGIASETMIEVFADSLKAGDSIVSGPYKALRDLKPGTKVKQETPGKQKRGKA